MPQLKMAVEVHMLSFLKLRAKDPIAGGIPSPLEVLGMLSWQPLDFLNLPLAFAVCLSQYKILIQ